MNKNNYIKWIINLKKNSEEFKKTLSPSMKSAFAKDLKEMFYAAEIENDLILQYLPLITYILKKVDFNGVYRDELQSMGMIAIRNSIWQYRNIVTKCTFKTYCYKSVFMRITGEISKHRTLLKRRNKKCTMTLCTDIGVDVEFNNIASYKEKENNTETLEILKKCIQKMQMKEDEKYLLNLLINRVKKNKGQDTWYKPYLDNFKHLLPNNKISKEGMRQKIFRLQKKFWVNWHKVQGLDIPTMPKPKMAGTI